MCEHWFKKRSADIQAGKVGPYPSKSWIKNLRYAKDARRFVTNANNIGQRFLDEHCVLQDF